MIKLMLFAFLMICYSMSLEQYNLNSRTEFMFCQGDEFPSFTRERKNLVFKFVVTRKLAKRALVFDVLLGRGEATFRFKKEKTHFNLLSIQFEFPEGNQRRIVLKFHSVGTNENWEVVSRVFTPPEEDSVQAHADRHAVTPNKDVMFGVAMSLVEQFEDVRKVTLDVAWVEEVLKKERPRFHLRKEGDASTKFYRSLPVILGEGVLEMLDEVRLEMAP